MKLTTDSPSEHVLAQLQSLTHRIGARSSASMLCGVTSQQAPSRRRRALSCISNSQHAKSRAEVKVTKQQTGVKDITKSSRSSSSAVYQNNYINDKENTPISKQNSSLTPRSRSRSTSRSLSRSREASMKTNKSSCFPAIPSSKIVSSNGGEMLPEALSQLRLVPGFEPMTSGLENMRLPLDRQTARRLINRHYSADLTGSNATGTKSSSQSATLVENSGQPSVFKSPPTNFTCKRNNMSDLSSAYDCTKQSLNRQNGQMNRSTLGTENCTVSQKSLSTNCSSIPTIQQSHIDLNCYQSDTTLMRQQRQQKRARTRSSETASDVTATRMRPEMTSSTRPEMAGHVTQMCAGKRRAVAIASDMAEKYGIDSRGLLRINVCAKEDAIIIQVLEAAELKSPTNQICSTFVKVEICPSISGCRAQQTSTVHESNAPLFNQSLYLNTTSEDLQKRLVISVWHADTTKRCSEFLGCLSFGIRHLAYKTRQNKEIAGWYHILPESLGHRKHILARVEETMEKVNTSTLAATNTDALCTHPRQATEPECTQLQQPNKSIDLDKTSAPRKLDETNSQNLVLKTITIPCGEGYGFTLHSTEPVTISRVRVRSAAEGAGLHPGDVITAVNQVQVMTYTARDVALLIRQAKASVTLDILCPHYTESMQQYFNTCLDVTVEDEAKVKDTSLDIQAQVHEAPGSFLSISSSQYARLVRNESVKNCHKLFQNNEDTQRSEPLGVARVTKCQSVDDVLSPRNCKSPRYSGPVRNTKEKLCRSQTYSVLRAMKMQQKNNDMNVTKWDPSLSIISPDVQSRLQTSHRNDSYHAAISVISSDTSLNKAHIVDMAEENKENSPFPRPTLKSYSTFSLATEAEIVSTGGTNTPKRRKRVVRRRLGCKKRLSLSANISATSSYQASPTSQNALLNNTAASQNHATNSNRISIVPYINSDIDTDTTLCSDTENDSFIAQESDTDLSMYMTKNNGFYDSESLQSCTLESDYYSDSPQYSHDQSSLARTLTSGGSVQHRPLSGGDSTCGSLDELWLICSPQSQERLVGGLRECEERFVKASRLGCSKYLWPARSMLSAQCFRTIFSNFEKLLALSEYFTQQMQLDQGSHQPGQLQTVLELYANKMPLLLEAYRTYEQNYSNATSALDATKLHSLNFQQFVQQQAARAPAFSLDDLLLFPLHHLAELLREFEQVHERYPEHENLAGFIAELRVILERVDLEHLDNASSCAPSEAETSILEDE